MAKVTFMSMRWLRMHLKEIIWTTVIMFVLSCFIIGYGSSRAQKSVEEKQRKHEADMAKMQEEAEKVPDNVKEKFPLPVVQLSYPSGTASVSRVIDLKSVYKLLVESEEYKRLAAAPENIKAIFKPQLLDRAVENLLAQAIIEIYAKATGITPPVNAQQIISRDKAQIGPEFDRQLRREGLSETQYGQKRYQEETLRAVFEKISLPIPAASATDEFLKKYYEEHKLRYKKDDEVVLKNLLITPSSMHEIASASDDEIRRHYEENRASFMSSQRYSIRHLAVNPMKPDYLAKMEISETEASKYFSENIDKYKEKEQVQARHILIRPKSKFDKKLDHFSVNLRDFKLATASENVSAGKLYTFAVSISDIKAEFSLKHQDFALLLENGNTISPTDESLSKTENPIKLPNTEIASFVNGNCAFIVPADTNPKSLTIKDGNTTHTFEIAAAHDEEKSFAAAEEEAQKILKRINDGADFAKMAEEYSEDPGSKEKGGDLGKFGKGQMVKAFEDVAFAVGKTGDVRGPVKTQFGWHLIKVEQHIPESSKSFESVRDEIIQVLKRQKASQKAEDDIVRYRESVSLKSRTFADLAKEHSDAPSKANGGRLPIFFKGDLNENEADRKAIEAEIAQGGQLNSDVEEQVLSLKKGQVSEVIRMGESLHIFEMEDIYEPVQLTLNDSVKSRIKKIVEEKKQKEAAKAKADEIKNKISSATFDTVANEINPQGGATELGPLPYSSNPGFTSYSLSSAVGQLTTNGRSYLKGVSEALKKAFDECRAGNDSWKNSVIGPVETELGYHFILVSKISLDQYQAFDDVKDRLKKQLTQVPEADEVKKEFDKNADKFDKPATRKLRQIVCADEIIAGEVYKKLQEGEVFAVLAQQYSTDSTRSNGGLVGSFKKGQLPANLDEEFWRLKKGEFTKPIKTNYGLIIATMDGDEDAGKKAEMTDEIAEQIRKRIRFNYKQQLFEEFLEELKRICKIEKNTDLLSIL
ncbi:MAG: peptidylprolyl isomerase [Candidatus Riflebacteria bacterium]|nr:peptidylprolyl isomerase [Candidatus Riflebacteria bacterium]